MTSRSRALLPRLLITVALPFAVALSSAVSVDASESQSRLRRANVSQSAGSVFYADRYANFATALAAATGKTLVINKSMAVSTAAVVPATAKLRFERGGLLQKSDSATITFQGLLYESDSPKNAHLIFSEDDVRAWLRWTPGSAVTRQ